MTDEILFRLAHAERRLSRHETSLREHKDELTAMRTQMDGVEKAIDRLSAAHEQGRMQAHRDAMEIKDGIERSLGLIRDEVTNHTKQIQDGRINTERLNTGARILAWITGISLGLVGLAASSWDHIKAWIARIINM